MIENMEPLSVNGKEYPILKLLGKGKGGYSYLALDGDRRVVLKQIHHEPCDYYSFGNKIETEINDYHRLQSVGIPLPRMIDVDIQKERIIKEYIDGKTVYEMVLHDELPPDCISQVRKMCVLLYPSNINIDYFSPPISCCKTERCTTSTTSATIIWSSGTLKIGG